MSFSSSPHLFRNWKTTESTFQTKKRFIVEFGLPNILNEGFLHSSTAPADISKTLAHIFLFDLKQWSNVWRWPTFVPIPSHSHQVVADVPKSTVYPSAAHSQHNVKPSYACAIVHFDFDQQNKVRVGAAHVSHTFFLHLVAAASQICEWYHRERAATCVNTATGSTNGSAE